jgi:Zn-dependent protease with chaperone function
MFAARCIGVSLAVFVLLYVSLSLTVSQGWKLAGRMSRPRSPRGSADFLFALRILPLVLSVLVTFAFTVPSFLLLEPRATDEAIGAAPLMLGFCCLILLAVGIGRVAITHVRASRALISWLDGAMLMKSSDSVPIFRTRNDAPSLTVVGVRAPKVLVSEAAIAALNPAELRTALRHEVAHALRYDNLKKLVFRFSVFPAMADLERAWSEQTEMAADDAAVANFQDALDLAAALIKISRLGQTEFPRELSTALVHGSTAISARVQRLVHWDRVQKSQPERSWQYALPTTAAAVIGVGMFYGTVLTQMHIVTEWLVR